MIKYALVCDQGHAFEGWFSNSADYDDQLGRGLLDCPLCGSSDTEEISEFGATACKALRRCLACREPFEHVKEI